MKSKLLILILALALLTGCNTAKNDDVNNQNEESKTEINSKAEKNEIVKSKINYPMTVKHALGETVIEEKPKRVATIAMLNHDTVLALGIEPVGISKTISGIEDELGMVPWTRKAYDKLENKPALYDSILSIDYEAISNTNPDIILAACSGITQEDYELLSEIAPTIAYPEAPWLTKWREEIGLNSKAIGMEDEGQALIAKMENIIQEKVEKYPEIKSKKVAVIGINPTDLGKFFIVSTQDPRVDFLKDLGMIIPDDIKELADSSGLFATEISSENIDILKDLDLLIATGTSDTLDILQNDPLFGTLPAVKKGAVAVLTPDSEVAASVVPSALSIPYSLEDYISLLNEAAIKSK
ncbi:MAG: iron-siderophore ABC transporter substrate-binding protein [Tissierellia bacterium]|nr:iron-siderophore ABC transporter substrate-binding protein [Tissierellia bacterium]